jgi:hypothetical protein
LARTPHLAGLRVLRLQWIASNVGGGLEALAASAALTALEEIDLSHGWTGPAGLLVLARSPTLNNLCTVRQRQDHVWHHASTHGWDDPYSSQMSQRPLVELGNTPGLQRWRRLDLGENHGAGGHLAHLVASPFVQHLTHLDLSQWWRWRDADLDALVHSSLLNGLVELNLEHTTLNQGQRDRLRGRYGEVVRF